DLTVTGVQTCALPIYTNLSGKEVKLTAQEDLLCRAIQHELDHLNGELFIDKPLNKLLADLEMTKHGFNGDAVELPAEGVAVTIQIGRASCRGRVERGG